jgi:hypothetical protein
MSIQHLNAIAGQILSLASTIPYAGFDNGSPADSVRAANEGLERFLAAGIGYALPLPSEPVANPKMWFGEQYGQMVGTLCSLIGEQRVLNPEQIALTAQGAWLYRYCQMHSLTGLLQFGQLATGGVAGIDSLACYCKGADLVNAALPLMALEQLGKLVADFSLAVAKDNADA